MAGSDYPAAPLTIRLFGPFEVQVNGIPLPRLRSRKGQWLLALLALRAGQEVDRAWLAGTLWPDSLAPQALVSLRNSLTDLRRALGPAAEAVCGDQADRRATRSVLDGLASLVDQSLLWQEEVAGSEPRFLMLETIREYGLERLVESGEVAALQRQHAQYFVALAEEAEGRAMPVEQMVTDALNGMDALTGSAV